MFPGLRVRSAGIPGPAAPSRGREVKAQAAAGQAALSPAPARKPAPCFCPWAARRTGSPAPIRSEEHTSELQSLMRITYAFFSLKKKTITTHHMKLTDPHILTTYYINVLQYIS